MDLMISSKGKERDSMDLLESAESRCELWKSAILRANSGEVPEWLTTEFLNRLVEKEINGREIKNIVRIGYALAREGPRSSITDDLLRGLDALKQFGIDFSAWSKERKGIKASSEP